ncbi:uncharacterized protein TNCV_4531441 [Trichonephila clavipes]|nr:uncharacterized protein TNCV_4531441 [Trichonephila clavipes]
MIANYVNDEHDTWDQFLREFSYAIRTAVNETTGKTPAELFLGQKLITPFQKLVMVSDGTEFAVGEILRDCLMKLDETQRLGRKNGRNIIINEGVMCKLRKKGRTEETVKPSTSGYKLRPRKGKKVESRPTIEMKTQQGGQVLARNSREQHYSRYIEEQARSGSKNTRRRGSQQQNGQERN